MAVSVMAVSVERSRIQSISLSIDDETWGLQHGPTVANVASLSVDTRSLPLGAPP